MKKGLAILLILNSFIHAMEERVELPDKRVLRAKSEDYLFYPNEFVDENHEFVDKNPKDPDAAWKEAKETLNFKLIRRLSKQAFVRRTKSDGAILTTKIEEQRAMQHQE